MWSGRLFYEVKLLDTPDIRESRKKQEPTKMLIVVAQSQIQIKIERNFLKAL